MRTATSTSSMPISQHLRLVVAAALVLNTLLSPCSSQAQKSERVAEKRPLVANQSSNKTNKRQYPSESSPLPIRMIQSPSDAAHADAREAKADKHEEDNLREQVRATDAAERQTIIGGIAAGLSLVGTLLLVWTLWETRRTANYAHAQAESFKRSERAYVKLSHVTPGLKPDGNSHAVTMEVKNWGKTPATVTDVRIGFAIIPFGDPLPEPRPYPSEERESFPNALLVPSEYFLLTRHIRTNPVDIDKQLWMFGHVDYKDAFNQRWRGGYARKYIDNIDNNLVRNTERRDDFDRRRQPGEGNDWNDE